VYTPTATAQWSSAVFLNWTALGNNSLFVKNLKISAVNEDADLLNGYSQTDFVRLAASNASPTNGMFAIGNAGGRNFIQSHNQQPLDINPIGNNVIINSTAGNVGIGTQSPNSKLDLNGIALMYQTGQTSIKTYSAVAGLQLVGYQSDPGTPFTKTSDIVANADGTVPSQMRLFTKASGSSSASERVRITSDGNVGIGTTSPDEKLTLSTASYIGWEYSASDSNVYTKIGKPSGGEALEFLSSWTNGDFPIYKFKGTPGGTVTDLLTIRNNGNVGIGTTAPVSKLNVVGGSLSVGDTGQFYGHSTFPDVGPSAEIGYFPSGSYAFVQAFDRGDSARVPLHLIGSTFTVKTGTSNDSRLTIDTNGNLYVGATTGLGAQTSAGLFVQSGSYVANGQVTQLLGKWMSNADDNNGRSGVGIEYYRVPRGGGVQTGTEIRFYTGFTYTPNTTAERMRIDQNGNIGIGLTNPGSLLEVGPRTFGANFNNVLTVNSSTGNIASDAIKLVNATATILGRGVGLSFYSDNATKMAQIFTQTTDSANTSRGSLTLDTTFGNIILSPNNGNVGIGTTSPTEKLHVAGKILMSGTSLASAILGGIQASYGGNANYPTLYGSEASRWVMHINPHISYVQSGTFGYTGTMTGATIRMAAQPAATQFWDIGVGTNSVGEDKFSIGRSGTALVNIDNAGNVGIGTTTPQRKLEVVVPLAGGDIFATSGSVSAKIGVSNNTAGVYIGSQTNHKLELQTNNNTKMFIGTDGNVGIGTTSPGVKLQVEGAIRGGSFSNSTTNSAEAWFGRAADRALGTMTFQLGGTTATNTRFEIVDRA
jgi:hypothetical protein